MHSLPIYSIKSRRPTKKTFIQFIGHDLFGECVDRCRCRNCLVWIFSMKNLKKSSRLGFGLADRRHSVYAAKSTWPLEMSRKKKNWFVDEFWVRTLWQTLSYTFTHVHISKKCQFTRLRLICHRLPRPFDGYARLARTMFHFLSIFVFRTFFLSLSCVFLVVFLSPTNK